VLVHHRHMRRGSTGGAYTKWFEQECPKLLPFTKASPVSVTGQGTFQGGPSAWKKFDKLLRDKYLKTIVEETQEDLRAVKVR
jgi:hypothetical protein